MVGVDIMNVLEIQEEYNITPVYQSSESISGLMNLRGQIIPVINIHMVLGLQHQQEQSHSHMIVLKSISDMKKRNISTQNLAWEGATENIGLVVNDIGEIEEISSDRLQSPPTSFDSINSHFVDHIVSLDQNLLILLNLNRFYERIADVSTI